MKSRAFGNYLKSIREEKEIPLRILARQLSIDTSTLSKIENGLRPVSMEMTPIIAKVLDLDRWELQIRYIKEKVLVDFGHQAMLSDALSSLNKSLKTEKINKTKTKA